MNKYIYPEAENWMWSYCIYLGPYESVGARKYDLGVYVDPQGNLSAAIVYGNEPGSYISGELDTFEGELYEETLKRARVTGL